MRVLENYEKLLDLPRWITLSAEQNLFDNAIPLGLWKNADLDLPELFDAKALYEKLKGSTKYDRLKPAYSHPKHK